MCVAVIIETVAGPTAHELWQMEDSNPHGAGLAWASGDIIRYKKGLTWRQVYELLPKIPRPALLHFRWATHGGRARHLTHPFPLGHRAIRSRKTNGGAKAVLIHNGVWSDYLKYAPEGLDTDKWSDTAIAAYVAGTYGEEILDHVDWSTAVGRASGNGRMDITARGHWTEYNGNLYSNLQWKPSRKYYSRITDTGGLEWSTEPTPTPYGECGELLGDVEGIGYRWNAEGRLVRSGVRSELAAVEVALQREEESRMRYIGGPDPDRYEAPLQLSIPLEVTEEIPIIDSWLEEYGKGTK